MSGINGVSFNTAMSNTNSLKKSNAANYAASFQGNTENTEEPKKKKSHKLLKALVLAGVAVAGYFLFKKHGAAIKDKLKNLFDSLKNKTKEVSQTADPVVKPEGKPTITFTEADVKVPSEPKKNPDPITFAEADAKVPTEPKKKPDPITFAEEDVKVPTEPKKKPDPITFAEEDVKVPSEPKKNPDPITFAEADAKVPTEPKKKPDPITFAEADAKVPAKPKKKSKQLPEDAVPPRRRVISDSADLKPGQKTKGRGVNYIHKERRNKKAIIKETLEKEQV